MTLLPETDFTSGDPSSRLLIDLCADRETGDGIEINASVIELAQRHGLIPILARKTDDSVVRAIRARESTRRNVLEGHLAEVLALLDRAGVRTAVVKGPAVASRYRDPSLRPFSDIDLLVPADQVELTLQQLSDYPATVRIPSKRPKADKRDVLMRDPSGVTFNLDLHWDLFSYSQLRDMARGATEAAWRGATRISAPYGEAWDIPDAFRLTFLACHAILDHRFRLILFRDLRELAREGLEWAEIEAVANTWGLRSMTYLALWMSRHALGSPVDDALLHALRPRSLPIRYLERALPRSDIVRFDGHRPHLVNLAAVLLNDSAVGRASLAMRAPLAFPYWRRRVRSEDRQLSEAPRTLIVVSSDRRRGAEVFTERLREGLLSRGWVVEAVALRGSGVEAAADIRALTESEEPRRRLDLSVARSLRRHIRRYRPGLIVANGGATLRYSILARLGTGAKLAYIGIGEPRYWIRSPLSRWLNRWMLRRTDKVLAVSEATRRQLIAVEPSITDRTVTTYTGLRVGEFDVAATRPDGPLRVVVVGSLSPEKDPMLALDAVESIPDAVLRFVGDGPLRPDLEQAAGERGMSSRTEFVGSVDDVAPHLSWAHVLLLTSHTEGLPGAVLEAGAAGIAVVAVDVGGVSEAVVDGVSGIITGRDREQLASALRLLHDDRELLAQMGKAGRDHVVSHFEIDDVIDLYQRALWNLK